LDVSYSKSTLSSLAFGGKQNTGDDQSNGGRTVLHAEFQVGIVIDLRETSPGAERNREGD
jgi:hypothetical protein